MTQTIEYDANVALRLANLSCEYAAFQVLRDTRLSIETTHYTVARRVLADVGLMLMDIDANDSKTLTRIVRAKVSK